MKKIKQALISVSDKNKLKLILKILKKFKIKIISSGGTYKEIKKLGYKCKEISKFTNFPEILDGRVKTLHPKIHGGILNRRNNPTHVSEINKHEIEEITDNQDEVELIELLSKREFASAFFLSRRLITRGEVWAESYLVQAQDGLSAEDNVNIP